MERLFDHTPEKVRRRQRKRQNQKMSVDDSRASCPAEAEQEDVQSPRATYSFEDLGEGLPRLTVPSTQLQRTRVSDKDARIRDKDPQSGRRPITVRRLHACQGML